jgi:BirA family biotin operon repressor/biotin-[acetyl-CoA-carboxylase] ligase
MDPATDVEAAPTLADPAGQDLADQVLASYAAELLRLIELAATHPGAARARVARHSLTLGTEVRVHLPGGEIVDGRARELADDGSLVVDLPTGGTLTVSAGDVEHLR